LWLERFWPKPTLLEEVIDHPVIVRSEWMLTIKIPEKYAWHVEADPDVVDDHDHGDGGDFVNRRKHRNGRVSPVVGWKLGWQVQSFLDSFPWREECFGSTFPLKDIRPFPVDSLQDLLKLWIVG
jgi:hypothetical protein